MKSKKASQHQTARAAKDSGRRSARKGSGASHNDIGVPEDYIKSFNRTSMPRTQLCQVIEAASLMSALCSYIQRNAANLFADDSVKTAKAKSLLVQDMQSEFFPMLDAKQYGTIQDWLAETCGESLEKYLKEHAKEDTTMRLIGYVGRLFTHASEDKLAGSIDRARCFLGLLDPAHKQHSALAAILPLEFSAMAAGDIQESGQIVHPHQKMLEPYAVLEASIEDLLIKEVMAACAAAAVAGNRPLYARLIEHLRKVELAQTSGTKVHDRIKEYYGQRMRSGPMLRPAAETQPAGPNQFTKLDGLEVLAFCQKTVLRRDMPSYGFSRVIAVREQGTEQWFELAKPQAEELFPLNGSLMHFEGKQFPQMPEYGSYAVWQASEQQMSDQDVQNLQNRVFVQRKIDVVHRVHQIEHIKSHQKSQARQWFENMQEFDRDHSGGNRLLVFEDLLFIRSIHSVVEMLETGFSEEISSWRDLPLLQLANGHLLYVGALPDKAEPYNLNEPLRELAKMLDSSGTDSEQQLTRSERDQLEKILLEDFSACHAYDQRLRDIDCAQLELTPERLEALGPLLSNSASYRKRRNTERAGKLQGSHKALQHLQTAAAECTAMMEEIKQSDQDSDKQMKKFDELLNNISKDDDRNLADDRALIAEMFSYDDRRIAALQRRLKAAEEGSREILNVLQQWAEAEGGTKQKQIEDVQRKFKESGPEGNGSHE